MKRYAKLRNRAELSVMGLRLFCNSVRNSKEAVDTMPRRDPGRERPSHNHLISNIGVNLAAMRDNRPDNVEEEAREKFLHPDLAQRFGQRC
jgi:hypothetical protein